ncbi:MAG: 23S rRNA (pseudouridine(1915)-N(3))-methyltransferase RlmH [Agriterribacter sp.]
MKIKFLSVGKDNENYLNNGIQEYTKRIGRYFNVEWKLICLQKNLSASDEIILKQKEAEAIFQLLNKNDYVVALDERGKMYSSLQLASAIQARANDAVKQMVFIIGGAYGLGEEVLQRANFTWSLSPLTFPHQLVRLILAEQVYRACTIMRNEKYHHA